MGNLKSIWERIHWTEGAKILNEQNKYPWCDKEECLWHKAGINSYKKKKKNHVVIGYETFNRSNEELSKWNM